MGAANPEYCKLAAAYSTSRQIHRSFLNSTRGARIMAAHRLRPLASRQYQVGCIESLVCPYNKQRRNRMCNGYLGSMCRNTGKDKNSRNGGAELGNSLVPMKSKRRPQFRRSSSRWFKSGRPDHVIGFLPASRNALDHGQYTFGAKPLQRLEIAPYHHPCHLESLLGGADGPSFSSRFPIRH